MRVLRCSLVVVLLALSQPRPAQAGWWSDLKSHVDVGAIVKGVVIGAVVAVTVVAVVALAATGVGAPVAALVAGAAIGAIGGGVIGGAVSWHDPPAETAANKAPPPPGSYQPPPKTSGGPAPDGRPGPGPGPDDGPAPGPNPNPGPSPYPYPVPTPTPTPVVPGPPSGDTCTGPDCGKVQNPSGGTGGPTDTGGADGGPGVPQGQTADDRWQEPGGGNTPFFDGYGKKEEYIPNTSRGTRLDIPGFYAGTACKGSDCGQTSAAVDYGQGGTSGRQGGFSSGGGGGGPGSASMDAEIKAFHKKMDAMEKSALDEGKASKLNELIGLAKERMNARDFEGAIKALDEAIKLAPDNANLWLMRAMAKNMKGDFVGAEADAREAIRLDPNNDQSWENLAWALLKQGKYKEALEAAEQALKLNPKNSLAMAIRAFAKEKLGDVQGAKKDIETAASMDKRMRSFMQRGLRGQPIFDARMDFMSLNTGRDAWGGEEGGSGGSPFSLPFILLLLSVVGAAGTFNYLTARRKGRIRGLKDWPAYLLKTFGG